MLTSQMYRPRRTRREILTAAIVDELRRYSVQSEHIGHAFAATQQLNATDLQALIAIMEAERQDAPMTAGQLGEHLNLTSGSVTGLLDRLERAGHIRRDRDVKDRRKIFLRYAEHGAAVAVQFFSPLAARTDAVMGQFTVNELEVVHRFLAAMAESMKEHRDEIRRRSRRE